MKMIARYLDKGRRSAPQGPRTADANAGQDLDMYWDPAFERVLDTWGEGNTWNEIQFLVSGCKGKMLDIACGNGKTIELLGKFKDVEVHGCDISDYLIEKAMARGISRERLVVCDATSMPYDDNAYDYSYSIGSLEHFTEEGIGKFIAESYRVSRLRSFHMVPTARSGADEGWMKTVQSFFNNSVDWWTTRFLRSFREVYVLDSSWNDDISLGKWFVCLKEL
jgi:ubiquinone/menaquinone biosynthesis C-methylase UbiE